MSDFPPQLPHGDLAEVLTDIFFVTGQVRPNFGGRQLQFSRNMIVVRDGESLTLVNTLRLDEAGLARLDALGKVTNLVKLGSFHGRDDAFYTDRYGAAMWAFPGMPHERGVTTDSEIVPGQPGPISDASAFVYETAVVPEGHLLIHRDGGVLLACDALQNWEAPDDYFDEATAEMMGRNGFYRKANIGPGWRNAGKAQPSDYERLMKLEFRHLLSAHGEPLLNEAYGAVKATVKHVVGV